MARWFLFPLTLLVLSFAPPQSAQALHISTAHLSPAGPTSVASGADLAAAFSGDSIAMAMGSINLERDDVFSLASKLIPASELGLSQIGYAKIRLEEGQIATLNLSRDRVALLINPPKGDYSYARVSGIQSVRLWQASGRGQGTSAPMPEPVSAVLFGAGLLLVGATIRRSV